MLYIVIEHFNTGAAPQIYRRAREHGRMLPEGLEYVSSWVDLQFRTCFQLMRTDDPALFAVWAETWKDLASFEIACTYFRGSSRNNGDRAMKPLTRRTLCKFHNPFVTLLLPAPMHI